MKKGIVVLLLVLALIVIVSPRIVGQLAERSVDENLNWAADNSGELIVASERFDRGWFSSQGQHRVELGQGTLRDTLQAVMDTGDATQMPALLINTRIDHGLIPVSSLNRDGGSLGPGLGSAISTLVFESVDGEQFEIPGKVLSTVGLSGNLESNYVLDEGTRDFDDGSIDWQPSNIQFAANPKSGESQFDGNIGALKISEGNHLIEIESIAFSGDQTLTEYGFAVGNIDLTVGAIDLQAAGQNTGLEGLDMQIETHVDDGVANSKTRLQLSSESIPNIGAFSVAVDMALTDADAAALGALNTVMKTLPDDVGPQQILAAADTEIKDVLAGGVVLAINELNVTLPMGVVNAEMNISIPESDRDDFSYSSLLLLTEAAVDFQVSKDLIELAVQMNPQVGMVVGLGYLKQNGDIYEMNAQMKSGLLTVNGAPIRLPPM